MRGRKIFFFFLPRSVYHVVSKEVENRIFRHNWIFRHKLNFSIHWESSRIIIFSCKFYIVTSDTLGRDSFLDVFFLLRAVILSELHEKPRSNKDSVAEITFDCTPSFLLCHLLPSSFTPSPFPKDVLAEWPL